MGKIQIPIKLDNNTLLTLKKLFRDVVMDAMEDFAIQEDNTKQVFNKKQASEYLDVSYNTLQKFIQSGLPVVNVDGVQLIRKVDIDSFLEKNRI